MVESKADEAPACVINDEVREYEPDLDDIFSVLDSGEYQRLIFAEQELREREVAHLKAFREFLETEGQELPPGYDDENRTVLRFL